ncbi:putative ribonuclease H-like domain-containing protein [Tanacetum coccineum]
MRMEQYLQCIDYTLWEIVKNGNAPIVTKIVDGKETVIPPTSVEEKAQRKAEFGGNTATKKTQKNLLKQQYENFAASSTEVIEQTYERLQKLISQLEMHEIETLSLDGLFNNLKAYESEVKGTSSSTTNSHNVAFLSSSSTNSATRAVNTAQGVNTASTQGAADSSTTVENLSDVGTQEIDSKNKEPTRRTVPVEETTSNALGVNCSVPPPYTGNFMPPKSDLVYPSLDDFVDVNESVSEYVVEKPTVETNEPETQDLKDEGVIDSGCSRYMTRNKSYLTDYKEIDGGFVAFRGNLKGGKITRKLKYETTLKGNWMKILVLLKIPRKDDMYSVDLKNVVPQGGLTCLFAKATPDESNLWQRRLGHVNFKTMNKLVRENLVRGLPSKLFEINQPCVACQNGKQHRASCRNPTLSFMRPFGCPITILNTIDHLVVVGNQSNGSSGTKACDNTGKARVETVHGKDYILLSLWTQDPPFSSSLKDSPDARFKPSGEEEMKDVEDPWNEGGILSTEEPRINQEIDTRVTALTILILRTRKGSSSTEGSKLDKGYVGRDLVVYHMDVKNAFSLCKIKEEVYVYQPPGCEDPDFLTEFTKIERNGFYVLHQAPRDWSTKNKLCTEFEKMMHKKFQMSSMGKLTFFL